MKGITRPKKKGAWYTGIIYKHANSSWFAIDLENNNWQDICWEKYCLNWKILTGIKKKEKRDISAFLRKLTHEACS